jgi:hypothetical protein
MRIDDTGIALDQLDIWTGTAAIEVAARADGWPLSCFTDVNGPSRTASSRIRMVTRLDEGALTRVHRHEGSDQGECRHLYRQHRCSMST